MSDRPLVAIITGELTPYRVHFHRRIASEIPEIRLATLLVVEPKKSAWAVDDPLINTVHLAAPERGAGRLNHLVQDWSTSSNLLRWLEGNRPSAVEINGYNSVTLLRAIRWCRRRSTPSFLWADSNIRCDNPAGWKRFLKRRTLPRLFRQVSVCMPCGSLGAAYFRRYGVTDDRIIRSPYEPDYDQIAALDPRVEEEAAETFALAPDRRRAVVSSRLVPVKRVDLAIRAFEKVADQRPQWDLVILGDGPLRDELESMVPARLKQRVRFAGFIGRQELVTAVYRRSDLLLHPAEYEPWALVINEAVAAGLAVVTTSAVGAAAELVRDGENGRIVPPGDLESLAGALLDATDPVRAGAMRAASPSMLQRWRAEADPIDGLRAALRRVGVIQ